MENPYYEIISLFKSLKAANPAGFFTADIAFENGAPVVMLDGRAADEEFWRPDSLGFTEEDDGIAVLCAPGDRGFIILAKLVKL